MPAMASKSSTIELLSGVPLFAFCTKKELRTVADAAHELVAVPGDTVVRQGAAGNAFYAILSGEADVVRNGRKVARLGAGDHFGDLALIDKMPRNASVVAASELTLIVLKLREFDALIDASPAFTRRLLVGLVGRLREVDARVD